MEPARTGLPGIVELHGAISRALDAPTHVVVVVIDIAHVITANLAGGWAAGNAVIEGQARRLAGLIPVDRLWHLGGDTFTTVLTGPDVTDLLEWAWKLREDIEGALTDPIRHEGLTLRSAASVWAVVPAEGARTEQVFQDIQAIGNKAWGVTHGNARTRFAGAASFQELADIVVQDGTEVFPLACIRAEIRGCVAERGIAPRHVKPGRLPTTSDQVVVEWWVRDGSVADLGDFGAAIAAALDARVELLTAIEGERQVGDRDPLTGLLNRRGFLREVRGDPALDLTVVFADLDHLKRINDSQGHAAGDQALCRMAGLLLEGRTSDVVGRWGGEEFVVALRGSDAEGAATWLRRLIERGRSAEPPHPRITFSAGVAARRGDESIEEVVDRADRALYEAKNAGRAAVVVV